MKLMKLINFIKVKSEKILTFKNAYNKAPFKIRPRERKIGSKMAEIEMAQKWPTEPTVF